MTTHRSDARDERSERDDLLHRMQSHSPEGVEADSATVRREMRLLVPLIIVGIVGTGVALHCIWGWLAVGLGAVVFAGYYIYGWGPALLGAWVRHRERARMLKQVDEQRRE